MGKYVSRYTAKEIAFILLFFSLLFLPPLFWDLTRGRKRKGTELHANWKKRKGREGVAVSRLSRTAGGKKEKLKSRWFSGVQHVRSVENVPPC